MARSTFYKRIPKHSKKPSKLTDLCHVCEDGKRDEAALHSAGWNSDRVARKPAMCSGTLPSVSSAA